MAMYGIDDKEKPPYMGDSLYHYCPHHKVVYRECLDLHEKQIEFIFPEKEEEE